MQVAMIGLVIEAFKGGLHRLLQQGLLSCKPLSIQAAGIYNLQSLITITGWHAGFAL